jgi:hypothetical protein
MSSVLPDPFRAAGRLLAVPFGALARARHGKSLHPRGAVFTGRLERTGSRPRWGVPWLDEPGEDDAVVRLSRGAGLPAPLPDLLGLAIRVPGPEGRPVDLLLSSTGTGRLTRYLPQPRRDTAGGYCSLMTFRSPGGTVVLGALPEQDSVPSEPEPLAGEVAARPLAFTLAAASPFGQWRPFARLELTTPADELDPDVRFDGMLHAPPGLVADGPMARLREPSYAAAREGRTKAGVRPAGPVADERRDQPSTGRPV